MSSPRARNVASNESSTDSQAASTWVIELERGWAPWTPGDVPWSEVDGRPFQYRIGKADFEAHFISPTEGTQTNLKTGKVRRLILLKPGQSPPAWEGLGARRRPPPSTGRAPGTNGTAVAAPGTAAFAAQVARDARRSVGDYGGMYGTPKHKQPKEPVSPEEAAAAAAKEHSRQKLQEHHHVSARTTERLDDHELRNNFARNTTTFASEVKPDEHLRSELNIGSHTDIVPLPTKERMARDHGFKFS